MTIKMKGSEYLESQFGPLYFCDLLKAHRVGEEMTQEELAKKLEISKQKVCDYEKGRRLPSIETVVKWAKKLREPYEIWVQAYLQQQVDETRSKLRVNVTVDLLEVKPIAVEGWEQDLKNSSSTIDKSSLLRRNVWSNTTTHFRAKKKVACKRTKKSKKNIAQAAKKSGVRRKKKTS